MERHFGNKIEESLFQIEKLRRQLSTEQKKKEQNISSDDKVSVHGDLFTVEGCCYELALFLLQNKPKSA